MSTSLVISRLETACSGLSGLALCRIPGPETPLTGAQLPALVAYPISANIQPSTMSVWEYHIPLAYLHAERTGDVEPQLDAIWDKPKALVDVLNANHTLGGLVYGMYFDEPAVEVGLIPWRSKTYLGFELQLRCKEKFATSFAG